MRIFQLCTKGMSRKPGAVSKEMGNGLTFCVYSPGLRCILVLWIWHSLPCCLCLEVKCVRESEQAIKGDNFNASGSTLTHSLAQQSSFIVLHTYIHTKSKEAVSGGCYCCRCQANEAQTKQRVKKVSETHAIPFWHFYLSPSKTIYTRMQHPSQGHPLFFLVSAG